MMTEQQPIQKAKRAWNHWWLMPIDKLCLSEI